MDKEPDILNTEKPDIQSTYRQDNQDTEGTGSEAGKPARKERWQMKLLRVIFLGLVAVFLIRYFYRNADEIKALDVKINWKIFAISILFYFQYLLTLASLWHYITVINGAGIQYSRAITAYLYSIPGKYIPGKVFLLLARLPSYQEQKIPVKKVTICFLLENMCTLLGAALLFIISLFFFPNNMLGNYKWAAILLIVVFFVCLNPKILNFFFSILEKITKKEGFQVPMTYVQILKTVLFFVLNWIVLGIGVYMLTCSICPVKPSQFLYVSGVYALSIIIGILAVFSPSGIGVREGILLLGFGMIMDKNYALIISIVARLWSTVAELVLVLIAFLINIRRKHVRKKQAGL